MVVAVDMMAKYEILSIENLKVENLANDSMLEHENGI